jgi:hypothetical protein
MAKVKGSVAIANTHVPPASLADLVCLARILSMALPRLKAYRNSKLIPAALNGA